jgi:hypothetical protein
MANPINHVKGKNTSFTRAHGEREEMWGSCSLRVFLVGIMDRGRGLVVERKRPKKTYGLEGDIYLFYLFFVLPSSSFHFKR